MTEADILIVGGGIQGITLLDRLTAAGAKRVLLVTADSLGTGETLHSHGYLHQGYAMSAAGDVAQPLVKELRQAARWWDKRIGPPYAPGPPVCFSLAADTATERTGLWNRFGLKHQKMSDMPAALKTGDADRSDVHLFSILDRLVSMQDILQSLAAPLQDRIARARLTSLELNKKGTRVEICRLSVGDSEIPVQPRMLLLACGRQAQPLLRKARTPTGRLPLESKCAGLNRIRFVPMLLVRGTRLPQISGIFETHGLSLVTHPVTQEESMWILTLMQGHETGRDDFDSSREGRPGGFFVKETLSRLFALVPEAAQRRDKDLLFSFYFGGKTDHPEGGNGRYLDDCGLENMRLAWPGLWSLAYANARDVVGELQSEGDRSGCFDDTTPPLTLDGTGLETGVPVGEELRMTDGVVWQRWPEFRESQGLS